MQTKIRWSVNVGEQVHDSPSFYLSIHPFSIRICMHPTIFTYVIHACVHHIHLSIYLLVHTCILLGRITRFSCYWALYRLGYSGCRFQVIQVADFKCRLSRRSQAIPAILLGSCLGGCGPRRRYIRCYKNLGTVILL